MAAATHLQWSMHDVARGGGLVGVRNNLLNKEWVEMCEAAYTPAAVTNEPKIHGVAAVGEAPPTGGRGGRDGAQGGIPVQRKTRLALTSAGIRVCSDSGPSIGCVSLTFALLTKT